MIDKPENTTETEQEPDEDRPKVRIIKSDEPEEIPVLDDEYYLSQEGQALLHHLEMDENDPKFAEVITRLQYDIDMELMNGQHTAVDRTLVEQFALLDKAFRFYLKGGDAPKPDERSFLLALRAQEQSSNTIKMTRRMMRNTRLDERQHSLDRSKEYERFARESRRDDKQNSRSSSRYYDSLSK